MPYIKQEVREELLERTAENSGELNFQITQLISRYCQDKPFSKLSYQTINDIVGALEGAKLEFYARVARPYEDQKIKENGDVY
jgi:hypothetical protein